MRRNLLLFLIFVIGIIVVVNSTRRLLVFKSTAANVEEAEKRLARLQEENEALKRELEYKQSPEFIEREIREKLGLVRRGEAIVVLPREESDKQQEISNKQKVPNYIKWWKLFFGS